MAALDRLSSNSFIEVLAGSEALANRKSNVFATWPARDDPNNRVEPIGRPVFDVPFNFDLGDRIFTIGSCFARNIEQELDERGYNLPTREVLSRRDLELTSPSILDNYGVTSILQEFLWAFDDSKGYNFRESVLEYSPGTFIDLHMPTGIGPASIELVTKRREAIIECTRMISTCRIVIITLGLAEVWFDRRSGEYLNEVPKTKFIEAYPDRFEFHVLGWNFVYECMTRVMSLIFRNALPGVQVLLTVSPVPLTRTHRQCDVMTANTYSKSVLRSVAETITKEYEFAHYFPSFESVVHSDRTIAYQNDLIHINPELTRNIVSRMLGAFSPSRSEAIEVAQVLDRLEKVRPKGLRARWNLLKSYHTVVSTSFELSYEFARISIQLRKYEEAKWAINNLPEEVPPFRKEVLLADLDLAENCPTRALAMAEKVELLAGGDATTLIRREIFRLRTLAHLQSGNRAEAISSAILWSQQTSSGADFATPLLALARGFKSQLRFSDAAEFFGRIADTYAENVSVMLDYAECLLHTGAFRDARQLLSALTLENASDRRRALALSQFLPTSEESPVDENNGSESS